MVLTIKCKNKQTQKKVKKKNPKTYFLFCLFLFHAINFRIINLYKDKIGNKYSIKNES